MQAIDSVARKINLAICNEMDKTGTRMGSTMAVLHLRNETAHVLNIGDSRIYRVREGRLEQLSKDHTIAQQKKEIGIYGVAAASHAGDHHKLTQYLGIFETEMMIDAHCLSAATQPGDIYLLCSDGLTDMVPDRQILQAMFQYEDVQSMVKTLVQQALKAGGRDNVSVIAAKLG